MTEVKKASEIEFRKKDAAGAKCSEVQAARMEKRNILLNKK